ncbi:MAG: tetratricopeptide repeat protein [Alphaproteobacteria bacterium]|nr:MAG: tetratricopeptide repeat protein [Alphaproteobacteria bacterium]
MRNLAFIIIALCTLALPALAAEPAPDVPKKAEVPFREDSGLITAEYYLATGKYAQALDVIGGVLARHPGSADAYTYRGFAYERLGEVKKAKESYTRALDLDPQHLGANRYLAGMYLKDGDLARAMDVLQVIRMTCGDVACQELDELQAEINRYKAGQKDVPVGQSRGLTPRNHSYYQN